MKNKSIFIIFPNQLFQNIELLKNRDEVYLVEEFLFFNQYKFHKQKLILHRASMKFYETYLQTKKIKVNYIESIEPKNDIRELIQVLAKENVLEIHYYDVCDTWLNKRIQETCDSFKIKTIKHPSLLFINSEIEIQNYFGSKKKYFQTDFYIQQRKKLNILLDENNKPIGGKWSLDAENRLKYPKNKIAPEIHFPNKNQYYKEAISYIEKNYPSNFGNIESSFIYPTTFTESLDWLKKFLEQRFHEFGEYEDAIVGNEKVLHHSLLTPMLNIGLLTPKQIMDETLIYANKNNIPLNSLEGFIRQIIGWREFIRAVYISKGTEERTKNFWNFQRKIPVSFYDGTTGIEPVDTIIKKLLETGYSHHIERLMILGNFMLLCEFHPDEVYKWFMELFIDSYDWVMVPNIYGMSQFADGGLMATKPYISGSSYILKMSDFKKGSWCPIWDALFWNFMNTQRKFFLSNPRLGMLVHTYDKMSNEKKENHKSIATKWLNEL